MGICKFVGELYKLSMLVSHDMMTIIKTLLTRGDDDSLECLCKLLTTVGSLLEAQCKSRSKANLDQSFAQLDKIVKERLAGNRIRFLIMDVTDLRKNNWTPRRQENNPKTMAEIQ